ncbi:hypothetical protein ACQJBY_017628 [Aegilops geniculata]
MAGHGHASIIRAPYFLQDDPSGPPPNPILVLFLLAPPSSSRLAEPPCPWPSSSSRPSSTPCRKTVLIRSATSRCFTLANGLELGGAVRSPSSPSASRTSSTSVVVAVAPVHLRPPRLRHRACDYETDATAGTPIDFGVDDPPSCLSNQTMESRSLTPPSMTTTTLEVPTTTCSPLTTTRSS